MFNSDSRAARGRHAFTTQLLVGRPLSGKHFHRMLEVAPDRPVVILDPKGGMPTGGRA